MNETIANRHSVMTLFSRPKDIYSHRTRLVLAEKRINVDIVDVEGAELPDDLLSLNPYHSLPTLVDRDLVLYDARVIAEYLDERFPHPPLMPIDPVNRAKFRLALFRIEKDWYNLVDGIEQGEMDRTATTKHKRLLRERLIASDEIFAFKPFFLSDEFSLVDAAIVPLLWRLERYGVDLVDANIPNVRAYMERVFARPSFRESLSEFEYEMRSAA